MKKPTADEIKNAREVLRNAGYFTDNLWCVADVQGKFQCTDEEAQIVLLKALENESTMEQIFLAIEFAAENYNHKKIN